MSIEEFIGQLEEKIINATDRRLCSKAFDLIFKDTAATSALTVIVEELATLNHRVTEAIYFAGNARGKAEEVELKVDKLQGGIRGTLSDLIVPKVSEALSTIELLEAAVEEQRKELDEIKRKMLL